MQLYRPNLAALLVNHTSSPYYLRTGADLDTQMMAIYRSMDRLPRFWPGSPHVQDPQRRAPMRFVQRLYGTMQGPTRKGVVCLYRFGFFRTARGVIRIASRLLPMTTTTSPCRRGCVAESPEPQAVYTWPVRSCESNVAQVRSTSAGRNRPRGALFSTYDCGAKVCAKGFQG